VHILSVFVSGNLHLFGISFESFSFVWVFFYFLLFFSILQKGHKMQHIRLCFSVKMIFCISVFY